ncbi:MAG: chromate efflux transporter [Desulfitobacteriaceae bacterium]
MGQLENSTQAIDMPEITLMDIFLIFFKMGMTAFGPSMIAESKKNIVRRKGWLTEHEFLDGLALAQFLPGATMVTLTVFMGYRIKQLKGAFTAFVGFILAPFSVMMFLSYLYFRYSSVPIVDTLFKGLGAVVVALIANAIIELSKSVITDWKTLLITSISLIVALLNNNVFINLPLVVVIGLFIYRPWKERNRDLEIVYSSNKNFNTANIVFVLGVISLITLLSSFNPILLRLELVFFLIGLLVFGNGFTMIPLIQHEVVDVYHWLNLSQFNAGIALGQITPGPVTITSIFIGYKVAQIIGAFAAAFGMYAPCFILVTIVMPVYGKIKDNPWVKVSFKSIIASFIGLIAIVLLGMVKNNLIDPATIFIAIGALVALRFSKIDVIWILLSSTSLYLLIAKLLA